MHSHLRCDIFIDFGVAFDFVVTDGKKVNCIVICVLEDDSETLRVISLKLYRLAIGMARHLLILGGHCCLRGH